MKRGKYVLINSDSDSSGVFTKVWAVEKENNVSIAIAPKQFFFLSLPVEKEIIINVR